MTSASRIAAVVLLLGIAFVTLCPIDLRPHAGNPDLERAVAYFVFGAAVALGFPKRLLYDVLFVCVVAGVLEALQLIDPGRDGRLSDALVKAAAGVIGILVAKAVTLALHRAARA
jgi:VanZ family protein